MGLYKCKFLYIFYFNSNSSICSMGIEAAVVVVINDDDDDNMIMTLFTECYAVYKKHA